MLHCTLKTVIGFTLSFILFFAQQVSAQWESLGPYGGAVKCMAVIDTFVYVGTPEGGLYRSSTRNIVSWKTFNSIMTTGKINAITAIGTTIVVGSADQGIFTSTDQGATWIQKNTGLGTTTILSLSVSGTTLYAGTGGGGVFKSTNEGDTWTAVNTGLSNLTVNALVHTGSTLIAATNGGIFYSLNAGSSWTAGNNGLSNTSVTSLAISGNKVFASTKGSGIFSATEGIYNWSPVNSGLTNAYVNQVLVSGTTAYAATAAGVFTSPAASISWTAKNTGLPADSIKALAVFENLLIAGSTIYGIYTSELTTFHWTEQNKGFNNLKTQALYANGDLVIVATEKGVYISRNLDAHYTLSNYGLTDSLTVTCLTFIGTKLFAGTKMGLYESADTGKTWHSTSLVGHITSFLFHNENIYVTTFNHASVYKAPMAMVNWDPIISGFQSNTFILNLAANGDDIYAGTNSEGMYVLKSGEEIWTYFNTGMNNQQVRSIVILGNKIFAATPNNGIFVSNLSSPSFSLSNNGLPDVRITAMVKTGQYILAGYTGGVYTSSDNGVSWQSVNTLLHIPPYAKVTNIAFSTDRIFITTHNNSVYSITKSTLPGWTLSNSNPKSTLNNALKIIPNPNNGTFKLDYSALHVQVNEISIYNYSGQLMDTFVNDLENISVNYSQGLYIVRLKTLTNEVITQKMIVE